MQNLQILSKIIGESAATALATRYQTLTELARADVAELQACQGVGPFKASQVKAALELASRLSHEIIGESPVLDDPAKVADYVREELRSSRTEKFKVLLLNARKRLIRSIDVATGTLDCVVIHARDVFHVAIVSNAASVVLVHCHPSSTVTPSDSDIRVTRDLIRAGQLLKIEVMDHVILGAKTDNQPKDYASLRELGHFYA